jgi:6-pyruvoyltetrahydropterin/6-carboxytetrahydropterin synthase
MWRIAKQFDFCYGHRVWSQNLNPEYSLDSCTKCRFYHGHQGVINIFLETEELRDGMVTDFKHLNWFKKWLDDTLDHKFIMDINDPLRIVQFPLSINSLVKQPSGLSLVDNKIYKDMVTHIRELYEGVIFVDFIPTSENLSKWIFKIVQEKMLLLGVKVSRVQFFETPKSQSNYINNE